MSMSTMDSRILAKITLSGMLSEPPFFTVYNWVALRRHNLSAGSPQNCHDKGLPVRTWHLRGLYAKIRGPYQDKTDRVVG